jgi:sigma-E factor negative regulatory protein RseC
MEEQGVVIAQEGHQVVVQVAESDSCSHCSAKGFCIMTGDGSVRITAEDKLGAKEGDTVTVRLGEGRKIAGTAMVFLTPLSGLFLGLFIGIARYGQSGGVIGALAGFVVGLAALWALDRYFCSRTTFRPRVTSIH